MKGIITADMHLRSDRPRCRLDTDWIETQRDTLRQIAEYANARKVPVYSIGDEFDTPTVSPQVLSMFLQFAFSVKKGVRLLAGNHSLPYHSWDNVDGASFGVLNQIVQSGQTNLMYLGQDGLWSHFNGEVIGNSESGIVFQHILCFESPKDLPPNVNAICAPELLAEYPKTVKWIFTGDMHHNFHYERKGRHVVNPGCTIRQTADMIDYSPGCYYIDTETETVEWLPIIDSAELVTDTYLKVEAERESRISAFVEAVETNGKVSLDFAANIEAAIAANPDMDPAVIRSIRELMNGGMGDDVD